MIHAAGYNRRLSKQHA